MNIYEIQIDPRRPFRWVRVQASTEARARKIVQQAMPREYAQHPGPGAPLCLLVESGADPELARHYGCINA